MLVGNPISCTSDLVAYTYAQLVALFISIDFVLLFQIAIPALCSLLVAVAAFLTFESFVRACLQLVETLSVTLLYICGAPGILAFSLVMPLRRCLKPATNLYDEEPAVPIFDQEIFRKLTRRSCAYESTSTPEGTEMTPAERVDSALTELGVPLYATDEQIRQAYRRLLKQYHPDFFENAPIETRERARKMSLKVRGAYDTAIGRRLPMAAEH